MERGVKCKLNGSIDPADLENTEIVFEITNKQIAVKIDDAIVRTVGINDSVSSSDSTYSSHKIDTLILNSAGASLNILDFGAVGDGATDDSTAINNAITQASTSGARVVYFPDKPAGYAISSAIILPSNVILKGDNKKGAVFSRIKPTPGYTGNLIKSANHSTAFIQQSAIVGLFFDGSNTTNTAVDINASQCVIEHCTFRNCWTYGIRIGGISSILLGLNNVIQNCYFTDIPSEASFWNGILEDYYTGDNKLTSLYIQGCRDAGIISRGQNLQCTGNHIFQCVYGVYSTDSSEKIISQNYIELIEKSAIYVNNGSTSDGRLQADISHNEFRNINTSNIATAVIELHGSFLHDAIITANRLKRDDATTYTVPYFVESDAGYANIGVYNNISMAGVLVTSETNITPTISTISAENITSSTNKNFVSDVELVTLQNTHGTNTGDETQESIHTLNKLNLQAGSNITLTPNDTNNTITIEASASGNFIPSISSITAGAGGTVTTDTEGYKLNLQKGVNTTFTLNSNNTGIHPQATLSDMPAGISQSISGTPTPSSVTLALTQAENTATFDYTPISYLGSEAWGSARAMQIRLVEQLNANGVTSMSTNLTAMGMRQKSNGKLEIVMHCGTAITTASASSFNETWLANSIYILTIDKNLTVVESKTLLNTNETVTPLTTVSGNSTYYTSTGWVIAIYRLTSSTSITIAGEVIPASSASINDCIIFKINDSFQHVWNTRLRSSVLNGNNIYFDFSPDGTKAGVMFYSGVVVSNAIYVYTPTASEVILNPNTKACNFSAMMALNLSDGTLASNYAILNYTLDSGANTFASHISCKVCFNSNGTKMYGYFKDDASTSTVVTNVQTWDFTTNALVTAQKKTGTIPNSTAGGGNSGYFAGMTLSTGVLSDLAKFTTGASGSYQVENFFTTSTGKIVLMGWRRGSNTGIGFVGTTTVSVSPQASTPAGADFLFMIVLSESGTNFAVERAIGSSTADTSSFVHIKSGNSTYRCVDSAGNIYIAGVSTATTLTFDGLTVITGNTNGTNRRYLLKYPANMTSPASTNLSTPTTDMRGRMLFKSETDAFIVTSGAGDITKIASF